MIGKETVVVIWRLSQNSSAESQANYDKKAPVQRVIRPVPKRALALYKATILTHSLTHSLTPWSKVLLEKLTGSQLVKKFPIFYVIWRFTNEFTIARHLSLSWTRSFHSMPPSHILKIHINIILPSQPGSSKWFPSPMFPHHYPVCTSSLPHTCYMPHSTNFSRFDHPNSMWWGVQIINLRIMQFYSLPCDLVPLRPK